MDFNTGGQNPNDPSRPLFGGEQPGPARGPVGDGPTGGTGGEFNLSDPIRSFVNAVRSVVLAPANFFRGLPRRGGFVNPLAFAVICALISALIGGILTVIFSPFFADAGGTGEAFVGGLVGLIVGLILAPIFTAIGLFIGAGITHLLVMLLVKPTNAGFEATFRVVSYVSVTQLISWIPFLGGIIAFVWGVVLSILGIREVHSTTTGTAALVVLIPVAVILLLVFALVALVGAALFFGGQQQF